MLHRFARTARSRPLLLALTVAACLLLWPAAAWAHPLGNFTINHYAEIHVTPGSVRVAYVLDMAEIPTFQEMSGLAGSSARPDAAALAAYHPRKCGEIGDALDLQIDGNPVVLGLVASSVTFPPGAGGLATLRLACEFGAPGGTAAVGAIAFRDGSYAERLRWREIVVVAEGVTLQGDYATSSKSNRLTKYPDDMLQSPLNQREVTLRVAAGAEATRAPAQPVAATAAAPVAAAAAIPNGRSDRFTQLITQERWDAAALLAALAIAFVWGALHALTPGHGKTIVAAYLVGSRAPSGTRSSWD